MTWCATLIVCENISILLDNGLDANFDLFVRGSIVLSYPGEYYSSQTDGGFSANVFPILELNWAQLFCNADRFPFGKLCFYKQHILNLIKKKEHRILKLFSKYVNYMVATIVLKWFKKQDKYLDGVSFRAKK